jgi:hypothetical protein
VTPEYNHGYPGQLKNAIDWLWHAWNHKPVAFVTYGGGANGARAAEQLMSVTIEVRMVPIRDQVNVRLIGLALDEHGMPTDEFYSKRAGLMLDELVWFSRVLRERARPAARRSSDGGTAHIAHRHRRSSARGIASLPRRAGCYGVEPVGHRVSVARDDVARRRASCSRSRQGPGLRRKGQRSRCRARRRADRGVRGASEGPSKAMMARSRGAAHRHVERREGSSRRARRGAADARRRQARAAGQSSPRATLRRGAGAVAPPCFATRSRDWQGCSQHRSRRRGSAARRI